MTTPTSRRRWVADLVEAAGALCLVAAASMVAVPFGLAIAGVALIVKALAMDTTTARQSGETES